MTLRTTEQRIAAMQRQLDTKVSDWPCNHVDRATRWGCQHADLSGCAAHWLPFFIAAACTCHAAMSGTHNMHAEDSSICCGRCGRACFLSSLR